MRINMEEPPDEINIVTLNCWGLKYISKLRRERLTEIGRQLAVADPQPHIVALQECWTQEDYRSIRRETRFILPYGKFYHSGAFGGGLAILSRWPIEESTMYRYPLNGRPTAFWRGDWYVGKGVACAKIRYGPAPKQVVEVFNTHTHAPYEGGRPDDSYLCHRTAQSWEMAKLLRGAADRGHLVIGLGDFNMIPMSLEHQLVTALAPVRDVWRVLHPDSSFGPAHHPAEKARRRPIPTAEFNIQENGASSDGPYNTWRWTKAQQKLLGPGKPPVTVPPDTIDRFGKRLDYIFAGSGDIHALGGGWVVKRVAVGMMMRHPELGCSLSDHFAVEATLTFHPLLSSQQQPPAPDLTPNRFSSTNSRSRVSPTPVPREPSPPSTSHDNANATNNKNHSLSPANLESPSDPEAEALHNGTYLHLQSPTPSSIRDTTSYDSQLLSFLDTTHQPHHNHHHDSTADPASSSSSSSSSSPSPDHLPPTAYDDILSLIHRYAARERSQRRLAARLFLAALAATVACLVGAWFSSRPGAGAGYVAFLLVLVSSLALAAGAVEGLLALLFFGGELRALKEFEWEIRNAKAMALGGGGGGGEGEGGEEVEEEEEGTAWRGRKRKGRAGNTYD